MQKSAKGSVSTGSFWSVKHIGLLALMLVVMLGMTTITGNAQATSGTILGTVTDATGAVVGNTTVQLISAGTGVKSTALTNGSGYYQFVDVIPGTYKIVIQKEGFKQLSRAGIVLQTEARIQVDLQLTVGASTETVEVTASSPLIEADNVSLGTVVDERETNELPLNGRNPMNLTALVASVIPLGETSGSPTGNNPMAWGNYQIGGGMAGQSSTYIDGSPDNGIYDHNTEIIPSQDSIAEFKVETNNMGAEYGRLAGGVINFVTKSGTQQIHGSTWEFIRNKIFNANTYGGNNAGLARAPFTQNQYGANFGGPVFIPHVYDGRKKTFVFANWEGFGLREGVPYTTTVPTAPELTGDLTRFNHTMYDPTTTCATTTCPAGSAIPYYAGLTGNPNMGATYADNLNLGDREPIGWDSGNTVATATPANTSVFQNTTPGTSNYINPTSFAYMKKMYPAATGALNAGGTNNYTANASSGGNNYQFVTHIDHDISDHQHVSGRYTWWDNINLAADPLKDGMCGQGECGEVYRMHNFILDDTLTLSAKTILDTRLSYNRYGYVRTPNDLWGTSDITSIGWPSAYAALVEFPGPPVFDVGSWDSAGLFSGQGADSTIIDYQDTYRLASTLTKFVGNHTIKFGAEFTMQKFNYAQTNTSAGLWTFGQGTTQNSSVGANVNPAAGIDAASYLLGYANGGGSSYADRIASESNYPAAFVTDDWRATQKLTFHVGVRWENTLPFTERHNRISFFDPNAANDYLAANGFSGVKGNIGLVGTPERPSRYAMNPDNMELSPRFGVSYRLFPNTVLNGGYGIFWLPNDVTLSQNPGWDGDGASSTPYIYSTNNYTPTTSISTPWPLATPGDASSAYLILPAGHNLSTFQYNTIGNGATEIFTNDNWAYTEQWDFGVQQQLGKSTAIDVSYAGASGTHLPAGGGWFSMDALPDSYLAGQASCTANTNCLSDNVTNPYAAVIPAGHSLATPTYSRGHSYTPFPQYSGISNPADVASSDYEALEVKLQKRFAAGASINVAYTFSKFQANTDTLNTWLESGETGIGDVNNMKGEKSLSSNDAPHRLVISYVYDIPVGRGKALLPNINRAADLVVGGWGLQGLTTLMKGFPLGISENTDRIGATNNGGSRPDVVPGCAKSIGGSAVKKLAGWYNTACFTDSAPFVWGNESRNDSTLESPGVANWDMSIVKKFPITADGRFNLQFRTEFFNLFNRVQFGYPNDTFDAPTGAATVAPNGANLPRTVQFALRVNF
jgi:hypothetical protein